MKNFFTATADKLTAAMKLTDKRPAPWSEWATVVTNSTPVTVTLDSDVTSSPRPVSANAAGPVSVGQRVRVMHEGTRLTITESPMGAFNLNAIPASANLDNYTIPGWYHIPTHTVAGTLTNYPPRSYPGVLQVLPGDDTLGPGDGIVQLLHYGGHGDDGGIYRRHRYDGNWSSWFPNVRGDGYVPARHLYLIGNTTIYNTVWTAHGGFNSVSGQDNDSEIAYSNGVFTVTYSGLYRIKRTLRWADWAGSWNSVNMRCVVNGSRVEQVDWYREDKKHYVVEFEVYVPANGTVAIEVYQSSGSNQTVDASDSVDNLYQIRRIT